MDLAFFPALHILMQTPDDMEAYIITVDIPGFDDWHLSVYHAEAPRKGQFYCILTSPPDDDDNVIVFDAGIEQAEDVLNAFRIRPDAKIWSCESKR